MTNEEILKWQSEMRALPQVYHVEVVCDGEASLDGTYDCREAAELHRDQYNKKPSYYGRARITVSSVVTLEMAKRRFSEREAPGG
jgi:hypothetical protein